MGTLFPLSGYVGDQGLPAILYNIYKQFIDCVLTVKVEKVEKAIFIRNRKILFASSNLPGDSLGMYLKRTGAIDEEIQKKIAAYAAEKKVRFGRALLETGYLEADTLWKSVRDHLKEIVFSLLHREEGEYQVLTDFPPLRENILLDADILSIIAEGMRRFKGETFLAEQLGNVRNLYVYQAETISRIDLKPHEIHVFDLVKGESDIEKIIRKSELLEFDTRRILYLFLVLEVVSTENFGEKGIDRNEGDESVLSSRTFTSFEEALKYYNLKYELIFRTLSKEIGPIALSILFKALQGIADTLPPCLKKLKLNSDGSLREDLILKSVWYHDFEEYIGEFLKGLEEILYAEIYAVKKHLGVEYEQQILKWINTKGN